MKGREDQRKLQNKNTKYSTNLQMGLLVDKVKPGGSGMSKDGNIARRVFNDRESARITGVTEKIIR